VYNIRDGKRGTDTEEEAIAAMNLPKPVGDITLMED